MRLRRKHLAYGLAALGAVLATVLPQFVDGAVSQDGIVALSAVGGTLLFAGAMWAEHIEHARGSVDERFARIHYRSGWNAFWGIVAMQITVGFAAGNADLTLAARPLIAGTIFAGVVVFLGSISYYRRTM